MQEAVVIHVQGRVYSVWYKSRLTLVVWLLVNGEPCELGLIHKGTGWPWVVLVTFIYINERGIQDPLQQY